MRLAPVPMFYWRTRELAVKYSGESSLTTHGAPECVDACRLFGSILSKALNGFTKEDILFENSDLLDLSPRIDEIGRGNYRVKSENEIRGSGYVVKSLEAALWCFVNTDNFQDAILKAVNLGEDADTTGAVCGQIAGAFYGEEGIPETWRTRISMGDMIQDLADELLEMGKQVE